MNKLRYSEIKDNIDVDQFEAAIGFIPLDQTHGGEDRGHCVFPDNHSHGDTTGKFAIHREKRVYNCWVCGGGSFLSLAMELYEFDVDEATHWLHQFTTGLDTRSDAEFQDYLLAMLEDIDERTDTMPYFNQRVLERFDGPTEYFHTRGIAEEVIEQYGLCYGEFVMKPAPIKQGSEGPEKTDQDYYGPTAIFPHFWQDKLVGWQHRWMEWDEEHTKTPRWLAKYTNTTDFPKRSTLFNYDVALKARQPIIVCESVPTVLFLASHGYPAVSYFGSKPTPAQLRLLRRFSQGVILAPDNDKTGDTLTDTASKYLERYIPVWIASKVQMGPKADLGDYAKSPDPKTYLRDHMEYRVHQITMEI